ncbi:MAG: response regulator transcription factor [Candidatus Omnitrophica bacterium]|nr:response regulator transcription factor [Candidatus Omnitrophota bacterium]
MTKRRPTIYVLDDDISVCRALSLLLKSHGFNVQTFTRAEDFLAFQRPKVPSCLVLDLRLPGVKGLAMQETIEVQRLSLPIVFISGRGDIPTSVKAMKGGAVDFLPKPFTDKDLLEAIDRAILKDKEMSKKQAEEEKIWRRIKILSPRELEVFRLVANGMLNKQIAYKRGTTLQTIKVHRSRVMKKMQAKTVTELIDFAKKTGLVHSKR